VLQYGHFDFILTMDRSILLQVQNPCTVPLTLPEKAQKIFKFSFIIILAKFPTVYRIHFNASLLLVWVIDDPLSMLLLEKLSKCFSLVCTIMVRNLVIFSVLQPAMCHSESAG